MIKRKTKFSPLMVREKTADLVRRIARKNKITVTDTVCRLLKFAGMNEPVADDKPLVRTGQGTSRKTVRPSDLS